ncbi:MAG: plastocyanin/azurin family copper-binding protein [Verrucomicrobiota bacterium]
MHPLVRAFTRSLGQSRIKLPARRPLLIAFFASVLAVLPAGLHAADAPTIIRIGTIPGLKFDLSEFSVRPSAEVEVIFTNSEEMLHNFVIVKPGTRETVGLAALTLGAGAAEREFVPPTPDVLFSTKVVPAGSSASLKFTAPATPGDYPYVCTFPGHYFLMFGTMIVTNDPRPPVKTPLTPAKPVTSSTAPVTTTSGAVTARAVTTRTFMPASGPASIAVQLPGGVSYCWDAGAGRFRYAWTGGYVTTPAAAERGLAQINGDVFYEEPAFPLSLGTSPGAKPRQVDFKGYTIDAQRVPEFETVVDGVTVRERAEIKDGKLIRRFRTSGEATVWFAIPSEADAPGLTATGGTKQGAFYKFAGAAAKEFTITMPVPPAAPLPAR